MPFGISSPVHEASVLCVFVLMCCTNKCQSVSLSKTNRQNGYSQWSLSGTIAHSMINSCFANPQRHMYVDRTYHRKCLKLAISWVSEYQSCTGVRWFWGFACEYICLDFRATNCTSLAVSFFEQTFRLKSSKNRRFQR